MEISGALECLYLITDYAVDAEPRFDKDRWNNAIFADLRLDLSCFPRVTNDARGNAAATFLKIRESVFRTRHSRENLLAAGINPARDIFP